LLFVREEKDGSDAVRILESYKRVWYKRVFINPLPAGIFPASAANSVPLGDVF
jgi:hypothetical protein